MASTRCRKHRAASATKQDTDVSAGVAGEPIAHDEALRLCETVCHRNRGRWWTCPDLWRWGRERFSGSSARRCWANGEWNPRLLAGECFARSRDWGTRSVGALRAGGGTRTHTPLRASHFKCAASAVSPPRLAIKKRKRRLRETCASGPVRAGGQCRARTCDLTDVSRVL